MNKNKKTVVIIARAFPPVKAIATERIMKLARSFVQENWQVILVTIDDKDIKQEFYDNSRMNFINELNIEVIRTDYRLKELYHIYNSKKNFMWFLKKVFARLVFAIGLDDSIGWLSGLKKILDKIVKEKNVDLIISSGSPFISFSVPYKIYKEHQIPYVLDFRDLWYFQPHGKRNVLQQYIIKKLENRFMSNAKLITTVSKGCKSKLAENTSTNKIIKVLYNIPDKNYINEVLDLKQEAEVQNINIDKTYLNLVYTGTLYEGRDLSSIAHAIQLLDKDIQNEIKVHYFGSKGKVAKRNFEQYKLENLLIDHGNVSKKIAISALFQADILLSIIHNSPRSINESVQGIITTKIFDYLIVNKATINIAPIDSEVRELLETIGKHNVFSYTGTEIEKISNKIKELYFNNSYNENIKIYLDWHNECVNKLINEVNKC